MRYVPASHMLANLTRGTYSMNFNDILIINLKEIPINNHWIPISPIEIPIAVNHQSQSPITIHSTRNLLKIQSIPMIFPCCEFWVYHIWRFPKSKGYSLNHPFLDGIFHYKPSILGYPHFWKLPYIPMIKVYFEFPIHSHSVHQFSILFLFFPNYGSGT